MSDILLFHHVMGVTDGVQAFAEQLRALGRSVDVPSLIDGRTFNSIEEGFAHIQEIGFDAIGERAAAAAARHDGPLVVGGLSLGVMSAQTVLQTRPEVTAAFLLHAFVDPTQIDGSWPSGTPVQVHGMEADPFFIEDGDLAAAIDVQKNLDPALEVYLYPGRGHLFTDSTTPDHDAEATALVIERIDDLLTRVVADPTR